LVTNSCSYYLKTLKKVSVVPCCKAIGCEESVPMPAEIRFHDSGGGQPTEPTQGMNMKKQLLAVTVAALFGFGIPAAQAATATSGFNVTVALTAACSISTAPTDVAFTYTSFQGTSATSTGGNFQVTCTNALPYTFSLDSTTGTVIGLNYSLVAPA